MTFLTKPATLGVDKQETALKLPMNPTAKIITSNYIQLFHAGRPYFANSKHPNFGRIVELVNKNQVDSALSLFSLDAIVENTSFGHIKVTPSGVFYKGTKINNFVADRLVEFLNAKADVKPLVNFLGKLLNNPNKHIFENLYKYLELYKLPIDSEGNFYTIKAVRENLTSKWDPSVQYEIGKTYSEPRQLLLSPEANSQYCGPGLWSGWTRFVFGYGSGTDKVILCKIDPKDVIATPNLESYQKLAACAITPITLIGTMEEARKVFAMESNIAEDNAYIKDSLLKQEMNKKLKTWVNKNIRNDNRDSRGRFVNSSGAKRNKAGQFCK